MSLVLARKYRPLTFDELIGQESISQTLSLALERDRLSHAYLFSGLRGSGKTSTARIFAKALLCDKGITSQPCGKCQNCVMAVEGRHMDIIEMDGASNRGIDDIKELIEHTKYKPATARYKIFIIDEVHMLTTPAFNALLKTLEEPPDFVKFILATTDPLKLPATILSRTQHFRFRKISQSLLTKHLEHILTLEGVEYEKRAIEVISRSGAGSVRDSLTLLDQAIVFSRNFIDISTVTEMLGIIEPSLLEGLIDNILEKDRDAILEFISMASEFEAEMIIDELMLYLKEILLQGSHKLTPMTIERFFRVLADSKSLLSIGSDGEFVLSLTLFKMMESLQIQDINSMIRTLENELKGIELTPKSLESEVLASNNTRLKPSVSKEKKVKKIEKVQKEVVAPPPPKPIDQGKKQFKSLVDKIYDRNYDLGECFNSSITYDSYKDNILTWESSASKEQKIILRNHWGLIRMFVQDIFGYETKIKNISKESPTIQAEIKNIQEPISMIEDEVLNYHNMEEMIEPTQEILQSFSESEILPSTPPIQIAQNNEKNILKEPMVAKALELFAPKKVRIQRRS